MEHRLGIEIWCNSLVQKVVVLFSPHTGHCSINVF